MPLTVGSWQGSAQPVDAKTIAILETDDVGLMEYRRGNEPPVWLARVAGFGKRAAFHPPEICYVGSHYEVLERAPLTIMVGGQPHRVMRLLLGYKQQQFEAWYWFTANGRVTPNYYQQQLWLVLDAIRGIPSSGTLVRLSTLNNGPTPSHQRLLDFLSAFQTAGSFPATS